MHRICNFSNIRNNYIYENMNNIIRTNKKIVRLTESDLRKIVRESIKTTLN